MTDLRLDYIPLTELASAPRNPKRHALEPLRQSIGRFGYVEPMVLDERTGKLVAGHGRRDTLLALRSSSKEAPAGVRAVQDEWLVPVIRGWASRDDQEAEAYLLASNHLTELGGWDPPELAALLADVGDLTGTGYSEEDLTTLLDSLTEPTSLQGDPDDVPEEPDESGIYVEAGDLYRLGNHLLLCGDATRPEDVARVLGGAQAALCWTDPPWNVAYGDANGSGRTIANDDLGAAFPGFCAAFCAGIKSALKPGAPLYMAMSAQEWPTIDEALRAAGFHWSSTIIWAKDSLVLSRSDYHRQYEPIWYGWLEGAARLHPLEDRKQSDLWSIPRPKRSEQHPTMKPIELVARSLTNSSQRGDVVFEPFSGSGTTLVACEQTGRFCRAIELEPRFVQVALERWQSLTGKQAEKLSR